MSIATKRRLVTREQTEQEWESPGDDEKVAVIVAPRGNNLHQVEDQTGEEYLVSMPSKFRKSVWIKRGDFVVVHAIEEGNKVKAEISHVLRKEDVGRLRKLNLWPNRFSEERSKSVKFVVDPESESAGENAAQLQMSENCDSMIDDDMLPPTYSGSEEEDEEADERCFSNYRHSNHSDHSSNNHSALNNNSCTPTAAMDTNLEDGDR